MKREFLSWSPPTRREAVTDLNYIEFLTDDMFITIGSGFLFFYIICWFDHVNLIIPYRLKRNRNFIFLSLI